MNWLSVAAILVFTFGTLTFGSLALLWLKDWRDNRNGAVLIHGFMALFSTLWFLLNLLAVFAEFYPRPIGFHLRLSTWQLSYVWPPLIVHLEYAETARFLKSRRVWIGILIAYYAVSLSVGLLPGMAALGILPFEDLQWMKVAFVGLFVGVGILAAVFGVARRRHETAEQRSSRMWQLVLWGLVFVVLISFLVVDQFELQSLFGLIAPSFPLLFVFVGTYYQERFTFFDVFVKRGTYSFLALLLLAAYFTLTSYYLGEVEPGWALPWFYALSLLPLALCLPWIYRKLESWLDRVWLGREFSPVEAVKYFLSGVQAATSERELIESARERLSRIFQASTDLELYQSPGADASIPAGAETVLAVPIRFEGESQGAIRMGRRVNHTPFFSKDVALLTSLAEVLSYSLENVRLQKRKQDQEKREKELKIHASRSELKALRAQINPHFLFNALNAIASLIHKDPPRAEETVEQLAEVFRYTLTGSQKEWARLEEEIDFVRAYLEVENARFGPRLETSIEMEGAVRDVQIPAMMVQTLVENAVKHGVAGVPGTGVVQVRARRVGDRIRIEVLDNGPGFSSGQRRSAPNSRKSSGYGLKNVRQRLKGHFGREAELVVGRDEAREMTVVAIEIPASVVAFRRRTAGQ